MNLGDYVKSLPMALRAGFRRDLAGKHGCSASLVRKWENHPPPAYWDKKKVSGMSRKHPADLAAIKITEDMTKGSVTRSDLRPEIWGLS